MEVAREQSGQGPTGVCWKGDFRRQEWVISDRIEAGDVE